MRRICALLAGGVVALGAFVPVATAADPNPYCLQDVPATASIRNVEVLCRIPMTRHSWNANGTLQMVPDPNDPTKLIPRTTLSQAIGANFIDYGHPRPDQPSGAATKDVMFVNGRFGLKAFDITVPTDPKLLDWLGDGIDDPLLPDGSPQPNRLGLLDDMWENEDMSVDQNRKLVFLSRDPRAYGGSTGNPASRSGIYVIDVRDPAHMNPIAYVDVPGGHTTTCVGGGGPNDCMWLWTGGPAPNTTQQALGWRGRPIFVTDMRDPRNPRVYPDPVDLNRNDGAIDYSHDVQVDDLGIAWVSGRGGVRGYWTKGLHDDPVRGGKRVATAVDPIPYAGGGLQETVIPTRNISTTNTQYNTRFMHNAWRPSGADAPDPSYGDLIYATEEEFAGAGNGLNACQNDGPLFIASLEGSYNGEAWRSSLTNRFRLRTVATWSPAGKPGSSTSNDCSAHYFQIKDRILSMSFYSQGSRFLDITNPTQPTEIAYFRPGQTTWATYPHKGLYYSADARGVYVLRLTVKAGQLGAAGLTALSEEGPVDLPPADPVTEARASLERPDGYICSIPLDDDL